MKKTSTSDIGPSPNYLDIATGPADIRSLVAVNKLSSQSADLFLRIAKYSGENAEFLFTLKPKENLVVPKDMVLFLEPCDRLEARSSGSVSIVCSYIADAASSSCSSGSGSSSSSAASSSSGPGSSSSEASSSSGPGSSSSSEASSSSDSGSSSSSEASSSSA